MISCDGWKVMTFQFPHFFHVYQGAHGILQWGRQFLLLSLSLSLPPVLLTDSYFSPMVYNLWFFFIILLLQLSQFGSAFKLIWIFGWHTSIICLNTSLLSGITRYFRLGWFLLLSHWDWPFFQGTLLRFSGAWGIDTKVRVLGVLIPTEVSLLLSSLAAIAGKQLCFLWLQLVTCSKWSPKVLNEKFQK